MTFGFETLMPWWALLLVFTPLLALSVVLLVARRGQRLAWARRVLMVLLLAVVAVRPVTIAETEQVERMNGNVLFVVDRTGSMNAEDGPEGAPRLEGVKADMREIMELTAGSRYGIIAFDSAATSQLPMTTDAGAAEAWIDTLEVEATAYSQGSNIDRPLEVMRQAVAELETEDPEAHTIVYYLSDGEVTDGRDPERFTGMANQIDAGAVLGYGTVEGGRMQATGGGYTAGEYIQDTDGSVGISHADPQALQQIARDLGLPFLHRPDGDLAATLDGITLRPIPYETGARTPAFQDWYWLAAIPLAVLFVWELGALVRNLPRRTGREDLHPGRSA